MDVIYQATYEDFNFFEAQVRKLDAERNQSIITSIFRTITGTRCYIRRWQVTSIPPTPITLGVASPTIISSVKTTSGMPVTITTKVSGSSCCHNHPRYPIDGRTGVVSTRNCPASDNR